MCKVSEKRSEDKVRSWEVNVEEPWGGRLDRVMLQRAGCWGP